MLTVEKIVTLTFVMSPIKRIQKRAMPLFVQEF